MPNLALFSEKQWGSDLPKFKFWSNFQFLSPQAWHDAPIQQNKFDVKEHTVGLLSKAKFPADLWRGLSMEPHNSKYGVCRYLAGFLQRLSVAYSLYTLWAIKTEPTYFVCNFVEYQRILMHFSLLELAMSDTCDGMNFTHLTKLMLLHYLVKVETVKM